MDSRETSRSKYLETHLGTLVCKGGKGRGMENAPKTQIDILLRFEGAASKNILKFNENTIPLREDHKRGSNRAMRAEDGPGPKMKAEPVTNVVGGHPKEVITKPVKSLKKSRSNWRTIPARRGERGRCGVGDGDGVYGVKEKLPALLPAFEGNPRGPEHCGEIDSKDGPHRDKAIIMELTGAMFTEGVIGGLKNNGNGSGF